MSKEHLMILEMLANGKITPAEANVLIRALGEEESGDTPEAQASHQRPAPDGPTPAPAPQPAPVGPDRRWWPRILISRLLSPKPAPPGRNHRRRYPDPSYAVAMKRSELDFSNEQLMRMEEEDIDPQQAARMVSERRPEWTADDIVELLAQGACPDLVHKLNEMGIAELSVRDVIQLTEYGVDPQDLERFKDIPMIGLTARDLIAFCDNDVNPDLAIALKETGPVTTADIVTAAEYDLSPSFVRGMARVLPGATVHQLIELSENDIDPNDAAWFRKKLGEGITPDDLLRLASHDVCRDTAEPLLEFNLPDLSVDTLIEMVNHDVCVDVIKQAQKVYGKNFTTRVLIEIADNW